jgi:hypothetical protein
MFKLNKTFTAEAQRTQSRAAQSKKGVGQRGLSSSTLTGKTAVIPAKAGIQGFVSDVIAVATGFPPPIESRE